MKIRANREQLADALGRAQRAVGSRSSLPVLQGLLCEASDGKLAVTGTDLEVTVRSEIEADVEEWGKAVVPGRLFTQAVRRMPPGVVTLRAGDQSELEISGEAPQPVYTLRQLSEDFPKLGSAGSGGTEVEGEGLTTAIRQVAPAASTDLGRAVLTGVLMESTSERLRMVATDSYRLALRDLPAIGLETTGLLPARGLRELPNTVGASKVNVGFTEREGVFNSTAGTLRLRMIEGNFPKYETLLPSEYPNQLVCDREALLETIRRMELVAEDHYPIRLTITEGGAEVNVIRQDVGRATDHVEGDFQGESTSLTVAFNPRYLADGVVATGAERVRLRIIDGMKPSVIDDPDRKEFLYLLMPVNV